MAPGRLPALPAPTPEPEVAVSTSPSAHLELTAAHEITRGDAGVIVAVIDNGYVQHPDLSPLLGWDFYDGDPRPVNNLHCTSGGADFSGMETAGASDKVVVSVPTTSTLGAARLRVVPRGGTALETDITIVAPAVHITSPGYLLANGAPATVRWKATGPTRDRVDVLLTDPDGVTTVVATRLAAASGSTRVRLPQIPELPVWPDPAARFVVTVSASADSSITGQALSIEVSEPALRLYWPTQLRPLETVEIGYLDWPLTPARVRVTVTIDDGKRRPWIDFATTASMNSVRFTVPRSWLGHEVTLRAESGNDAVTNVRGGVSHGDEITFSVTG